MRSVDKIIQRHKSMKRTARSAIIGVLCILSIIPAEITCSARPAAPKETTLTDDILTATSLLEELLSYQYENMRSELKEQIAEKGWNQTFTMQSFENAGNPFEALNYQETIAAICVLMSHKDILITDIRFASMTTTEESVEMEVPLKTDNFKETMIPDAYEKNGIRYITESGIYHTYEFGADGYYHISGTEEIILEKEPVLYGSVKFSAVDPESIMQTYGLELNDYREEYEERLLRIQTGDYTEQGLEQSIFLNLMKEQFTGEEESKALENALASVSGNRQILVSVAASLIGQVPYQWGGKASAPGYDNSWWTFGDNGVQKGLDCSGFVQWAYMSAGYPQDTCAGMVSTSSMLNSLEHISADMLMPGDIGIMHDGSEDRINHAGIYIGNGYWIHCSSSAGTVAISRFDFKVYLRATGADDAALSAPVYGSSGTAAAAYSAQDIYLLAQTVWHEARGEGMNGWVAVAEVILNRVNSPLYPDTISEVVYQGSDGGKEQFQNSSEISSCTPSEAVLSVVRMVAEGKTSVLNDPDVLYFRNPGDMNDNSDWGNCPFYTRIGNHAFYLAQGTVPGIEKKEVPTTTGQYSVSNDKPTGTSDIVSEAEDEEKSTGIIEAEGDIPESRIKNIEANYKTIPENIRNHLESKGWRYICTDRNFGRENGFKGSILALTEWKDRIIYIDNRDAAEKSILHEVGHAVDKENLAPSVSQDFTAIFNSEKCAFCSVWNTDHNNTDTSVEYFAECFYVYFANPEILSASCPATYAFIDSIAKSM